MIPLTCFEVFDLQNKRLELLRDQQYLEIRHVKEDDAGIYTCSAENLAGKAKQDLELHVLGEKKSLLFSVVHSLLLVPPRLGHDALNIEATVNSTVNLTCSAYGKPKPTVSGPGKCGDSD